MFVVGLTGGLASGKSTVSGILRELGARIIDADRLAHRLMEPGQPVWAEVVHHFGPQVLGEGGRVDRARLARIVFQDPERLRLLNSLSHPRVIAASEEILARWRREIPRGVAVVDAPLLLEAGMERLVDEVWVVAVSPQTQIIRAAARDKLSAEEAARRLAAQMPLAEKIRRAQRVIDNEGSLAATRRQVEEYWRAALARAQGEAGA